MPGKLFISQNMLILKNPISTRPNKKKIKPHKTSSFPQCSPLLAAVESRYITLIPAWLQRTVWKKQQQRISLRVVVAAQLVCISCSS